VEHAFEVGPPLELSIAHAAANAVEHDSVGLLWLGAAAAAAAAAVCASLTLIDDVECACAVTVAKASQVKRSSCIEDGANECYAEPQH
jgi:hypothetical protein